MRILLVDDDREVREIMAGMLRQIGHEVSLAEDGRQALELFRAGGNDLILTDLLMPNKDGVELIAAVRRINATVPIIAMSGGYRTDSLQSIANASAVGANEILYKPFGVAELKTVLERLKP